DSLIIGYNNELDFESYKNNAINKIRFDCTPKQVVVVNNSLIMLDTDGVLYQFNNNQQPVKSGIRNVIKLLQSNNNVVVVKQSSLALLRLYPKLTIINELPLPAQHTHSAINNNIICLADISSTYSLVNLNNSRSVVHQSPHLFTVLDNNSLQPSFLQTAPLGLDVPQLIPNQLELISFPLLDNNVDYGGSSKGPSNNDSQTETTQVILATKTGGLYAFIPPSLFQQSICLLEMETDGAREQALSLAKTLKQDGLDYQYIHLYAALQLFKQTSFNDASILFTKSQCDIRLILRWFPDLIAGLFDPDEFVRLPLGISTYISKIPHTIDQVIVANLEKNYSPYLSVEEDEPIKDLKTTLMNNARTMVLECLSREHRKRRRSRQSSHSDSDAYTDMILDTCLAIIFAEKTSMDRNALSIFVSQPNTVLLPIAEPTLVKQGRYTALARLYETHGDTTQALEIHKGLVEGSITDIDSVESLKDTVRLLNKVEEPDVLLNYGLWLLAHNRSAGLQALSSHPKTPLDETKLLESLGNTDKIAEQEYLEILVLARNRDDKDIRRGLLERLIGNVLGAFKNESISKNMAKIDDEYKSQRCNKSYTQYLTNLLENDHTRTDVKESIKARIKLVLYLQISTDLDWSSIMRSLEPLINTTLMLEKGVILGKLEQHNAALNILARQLKDTYSAQHYCAFPGFILSANLARKCINDSHLSNSWLVALARTSMVAVSPSIRSHLLRVLLDVYMVDGDFFSAEIASLLGSQALHLDFIETLPKIPNDIPLASIKDFMLRQLRRSEHRKRELSILKGIAAAENLTRTEEAWLATREAGAVVEEAVDDTNNGYEKEK
ncbi:hypothetical protein E3Q06_01660, partial [Wallemia mellicola]